MRLIFINRFYWPETPATGQLLTDLAEGLAARGHEVEVITSHSGAVETPWTETRHGVRIRRVRSTRRAHALSAGKVLDWGTFLVAAVWRLLLHTRRGTTVIAMTDPPLLGIGVSLASWVRDARVIHWVQDIYPEIAIELTGHRWLAPLKLLRDLAWRRADRCVTLGRDMGAILMKAGVNADRLWLIPNAAPTEVGAEPPPVSTGLRSEWRLEGRFVVAYSGNLGRVHDLEPVLEVADRLRKSPEIAFVFIGDGAQRPALEREAAQRQLPNVQFQPAQPRARLAESLAMGDLHLVTLRPGCEHYVFPSKFYGIIAAGRPVIYIGPVGSELAQIIIREGLGLVFARDQTAELATALRALAGDPQSCRRFADAARGFAVAENARTVPRWSELLSGLEAC
jgi:colanic acid biosynthesis glycosyl transferase WcaI